MSTLILGAFIIFCLEINFSYTLRKTDFTELLAGQPNNLPSFKCSKAISIRRYKRMYKKLSAYSQRLRKDELAWHLQNIAFLANLRSYLQDISDGDKIREREVAPIINEFPRLKRLFATILEAALKRANRRKTRSSVVQKTKKTKTPKPNLILKKETFTKLQKLNPQLVVEIKDFIYRISETLPVNSMIKPHFYNTVLILDVYDRLKTAQNEDALPLDAAKVAIILLQETNNIKNLIGLTIQYAVEVKKENAGFMELDEPSEEYAGYIETITPEIRKEIEEFTEYLFPKLLERNPVRLHLSNGLTLLRLYDDMDKWAGDLESFRKLKISERTEKLVASIQYENNVLQDLVEKAISKFESRKRDRRDD